MLEHAVVNNNPKIIAEYLNKGVSVTLFHFQIAARLGYEAPHQLLTMVRRGTIFVRAGNKRGEDDLEDSRLLKGRASLNPTEKARLANVSTTTSGRQRGEFTSPTLQAMLQAEEMSSPNYQSVLGHQHPPVAERVVSITPLKQNVDSSFFRFSKLWLTLKTDINNLFYLQSLSLVPLL